MDKQKILIRDLGLLLQYLPEMEKDIRVLLELISTGNVDESFRSNLEPIMDSFIRCVQTHRAILPKGFFVVLYGSVLEYEIEISQISTQQTKGKRSRRR